jgi:hypothetical protein
MPVARPSARIEGRQKGYRSSAGTFFHDQDIGTPEPALVEGRGVAGSMSIIKLPIGVLLDNGDHPVMDLG